MPTRTTSTLGNALQSASHLRLAPSGPGCFQSRAQAASCAAIRSVPVAGRWRSRKARRRWRRPPVVAV
ncbi:hypothetical protein OHV13_34425 [Kitasatospora purpeofusca]|uniref:hypothetical protein n=1 Tax=Kitasatospora purpeofusca TaxID=67352 RepID=UPI003252ECA3